MTQASFNLSVKKTRKREFLAQMDKVVPWRPLIDLNASYYPEGKNGRPTFSPATMVRIHFLHRWFTLSDPDMGEAFFDVPLYREFVPLQEFSRLPEESTSLRFCHRLEKHKLANQLLATVNNWLIERGLLLKTGTMVDAYGDAGYQGIHKRPHAKSGVTWRVAMVPGKRIALNKSDPLDQLTDTIEKAKASVRTKVAHPFCVIKRQFGHVQARYRGLIKLSFFDKACGWTK
jgi:IS5 family transposase